MIHSAQIQLSVVANQISFAVWCSRQPYTSPVFTFCKHSPFGFITRQSICCICIGSVSFQTDPQCGSQFGYVIDFVKCAGCPITSPALSIQHLTPFGSGVVKICVKIYAGSVSHKTHIHFGTKSNHIVFDVDSGGRPRISPSKTYAFNFKFWHVIFLPDMCMVRSLSMLIVLLRQCNTKYFCCPNETVHSLNYHTLWCAPHLCLPKSPLLW